MSSEHAALAELEAQAAKGKPSTELSEMPDVAPWTEMTAESTPYARWHRAKATSNHPDTPTAGVTLVNESVVPNESRGKLTADAACSDQMLLKFELSVLPNGVLRIVLSPTIGNYVPRAHVAFENTDTFEQFRVVSKTDTALIFSFNNEKLLLNLEYSPLSFKVHDSVTNVVLFEWNQRNLLHFARFNDEAEPTSFNSINGLTSIGFDATFPFTNNIYGLPERATRFNLPTTRGENAHFSEPYRLFNLDKPEYKLDASSGLYGQIPYAVACSPDAVVGLIWDNSSEIWVDVEKTDPSINGNGGTQTHWIAQTGDLDLLVLFSTSPKSASTLLSRHTGLPALPQQFSLGYHQCRWSYYTQQEVMEEVDAQFDQHDIPYDVLWLDIDHTNGKRYFTWDLDAFPDPIGMQDALAKKGRKMVSILDPHIKVDPDYHIYAEAQKRGYLIKDADGTRDSVAECWPGKSVWLDFLNPLVRDFWATQLSMENYKYSTSNLYTWNDMNEPAVFGGSEGTLPRNSKHVGGVPHAAVHNAYGVLQQMSSHAGHLIKSRNQDRPFVLTRSFYIGTQKYGAVWTGDCGASWEYLAYSVPMLLTLGVSGVTFCGGKKAISFACVFCAL